jgi:glutamyl-tRNA(Gln) amidotransferase subunit E
MRKIVIDGSNTTGFQRTAVVGLNGTLDVDGKKIPIQQVTLEEDAARKLNETKTSTIFRLDRLGVPLIEIATGPVINSPMEAGKVALAIGQLLRSTKQVKRGLGTIRQDLNVSIKDGSLIEIKGVQELELVSEAVEYEVQRQLKLLEIRDELKTRNVTRSSLQHNEIVDVTELFSGSPSKVVQASLKHGGTVLALKLQGFKGLLGRELVPGIRLGTEMAKRAIFYGRVGGIFHSDELPGYGITATEIEKLVSYLSCNEKDGFAIIADDRQNAMEGLNAVLERACEAIEGVPEETRVANPDGTTHYLRPRPGAARMYPETDVPPVQINLEKLENIKFNLPKSTTELAKEIEAKYSISTKLALQIAESDYLPTFEAILAHSKNLGASFTATILTESTRSLAREGVPIENVTDTDLREIFEMVADGETAKESVIDLLRWLATHPGSHPQDALDKLNLHMLQRSDLEQIISKVLMAHKDHAQSNVNKEYGKIMNMVMAQVRGRADPKIVNEILHDKMDRMTR